MKNAKKRIFVVIGGKWFDSINGNTYHNSKIIDIETGKTFYCGYQYGYGSQYITSAKEYITDILMIDNFTIIDGGSFVMKKQVVKNGWF